MKEKEGEWGASEADSCLLQGPGAWITPASLILDNFKR